MKVVYGVFISLFVTAIIASAKAIVDVEVLKVENKNSKQMFIEAAEDRQIIKDDIKSILKKL